MPNLARSTYENFRPFFDKRTNSLITQYKWDKSTLGVNLATLGWRYASFYMFLKLLPVFLVHITKLLKNLVFLLCTVVLAFLAFFMDKQIAYQLALATIIRTSLLAFNFANAMLAIISPFVNGMAMLINSVAELACGASGQVQVAEYKLIEDSDQARSLLNYDGIGLNYDGTGIFSSAQAPNQTYEKLTVKEPASLESIVVEEILPRMGFYGLT